MLNIELMSDSTENPITSSSSSPKPVLLPNPLVLLAFIDNSRRSKLFKIEIARYLYDSDNDPLSFNKHLADARGENEASKKIDALYCQKADKRITLQEILSVLNLDVTFLSGLSTDAKRFPSVKDLRALGPSKSEDLKKMLEFFALLKMLIEPDWLKLSILCDRVDDKNLSLLFRLIEKFVSDHSEKWGCEAPTNAYLFLRSQHQNKPYMMAAVHTRDVICAAESFNNSELKNLVACINGSLETATQEMIDVIDRAAFQDGSVSVLVWQQVRDTLGSSNIDFHHNYIPSYEKALALSKTARKFLKDLNNVMASKEVTKNTNLIIFMQFLICILIFKNVCRKSASGSAFWFSNSSSDASKNAVLSFLLLIFDNLKFSLPFKKYKNDANECFLQDAYDQSGLSSVLSIEEYKKTITSSADLQAVWKLFPWEFLELIKVVEIIDRTIKLEVK